MWGWLVNKIIIILSFRVGTSKNKNIDELAKETWAIMSTQVTCETDHISLIVIQKCQVHYFFCFLCISL